VVKSLFLRRANNSFSSSGVILRHDAVNLVARQSKAQPVAAATLLPQQMKAAMEAAPGVRLVRVVA
jgi:hypothetical protein